MMKAIKWIVAIALLMLFWICENSFASDVKISTEKVEQGKFFFVRIENSAPTFYRIGFLKKQYISLPLLGYTKTQFAVIPVSVDAPVGKTSISIESELEFILPKEIEILKTNFPVFDDVIVNNPLNVSELKRYEKEQDVLKGIYSRNTKYPFFDERYFIFANPLDGTPSVSSEFGTVRKIKTGQKGEAQIVSHFGTDYSVPVRTKVFATETGIVVFAGDFLLSGKTIILDHGFGVFSAYFHLFDIGPKEGDVALRGELIALSGATGRVRGAHLHFGVNIHGIWVNPDWFFPPKEKQ